MLRNTYPSPSTLLAASVPSAASAARRVVIRPISTQFAQRVSEPVSLYGRGVAGVVVVGD